MKKSSLLESIVFQFMRFLSLFVKLEPFGFGNIPTTGPVMIIANHQSNWDSLWIWFVFACIQPNRKISVMAKKELFGIPILSGILSAMGAFPVDRKNPSRTSLRTAKKILANGDILGIFPQGTRNGKHIHAGFWHLSHVRGSSLIPVYAITMKYGKNTISLRVTGDLSCIVKNDSPKDWIQKLEELWV